MILPFLFCAISSLEEAVSSSICLLLVSEIELFFIYYVLLIYRIYNSTHGGKV